MKQCLHWTYKDTLRLHLCVGIFAEQTMRFAENAIKRKSFYLAYFFCKAICLSVKRENIYTRKYFMFFPFPFFFAFCLKVFYSFASLLTREIIYYIWQILMTMSFLLFAAYVGYFLYILFLVEKKQGRTTERLIHVFTYRIGWWKCKVNGVD